MEPRGPNQLWVADLTYVAVVGRFVYVALVIDAWSRRIVGWAISRSIDTRLALAALEAAIGWRQPTKGVCTIGTAGVNMRQRPNGDC